MMVSRLEVMICKIGERQKDFSQIRNLTLRDSRLSINATAVMAFLLSYPEDWEIRMAHICSRFHVSKSTMARVFKELSSLGYAVLYSIRGEGGTWKGRQYTIYEEPKKEAAHPNVISPNMGETPMSVKSVLVLRKTKKTNSSESEFAAEGVGGFFKLNGEFSQFIKTAAAKLEDYIRSIHKIDPKIKRASWCKEFVLLLDSIGGDKQRLKAAMKGYISTPLEKLKPQAWCARSFRKKFLQIESYLKKRSQKQPESDYKVPEYEEEIVK